MMQPVRLGIAMCGSFCTFSDVLAVLRALPRERYALVPILSEASFSTDTRFSPAAQVRAQLEQICGRQVVHTLAQAEPIGPKKLLDVLAVVPCTGNTLAKLANGITDTPVTLAVKAHLRNERPVVIAVSTNDALASAGKNIGALLNYKNIYFVPMKQDDCINKPRSVVADFIKIPETVEAALLGRQIQPVIS